MFGDVFATLDEPPVDLGRFHGDVTNRYPVQQRTRLDRTAGARFAERGVDEDFGPRERAVQQLFNGIVKEEPGRQNPTVCPISARVRTTPRS